jgi:hypothetical protein
MLKRIISIPKLSQLSEESFIEYEIVLIFSRRKVVVIDFFLKKPLGFLLNLKIRREYENY